MQVLFGDNFKHYGVEGCTSTPFEDAVSSTTPPTDSLHDVPRDFSRDSEWLHTVNKIKENKYALASGLERGLRKHSEWLHCDTTGCCTSSTPQLLRAY